MDKITSTVQTLRLIRLLPHATQTGLEKSTGVVLSFLSNPKELTQSLIKIANQKAPVGDTRQALSSIT